MELEVQKVIVSALKTNPTLTSLIGDRVYDRVPDNAVFPYVNFGEFQAIEADATCITSYELFVDIHAWSKTFGSVECKAIVAAVRNVLHDGDALFNGIFGADVVECQVQTSRVFLDSDGTTTHGVVTLRVLIDKE